MIDLHVFNFNPLQVNNYIIYDDTRECVVIDATCYFESEKDELRKFIQKNQLRPVKLLNTHCHFDHVVGNKFMFDNYKTPLYAHKADEFLLDDVVAMSSIFGLKADTSPKIEVYLKEGDKVRFGNNELEVLHVPGHSPGSLAFLLRREKWLFSGDVLFNGSVGRTDLTGGNHNDLVNSIKNKLYTLDPSVKVYPGHGSATTIRKEIDSNPFVR